MSAAVDRLHQFSATPIGGTLLTLIFVTVIGGGITSYFIQQREGDKLELQSNLQARVQRQKMHADITQTIYDRRIHLGNVASEIQMDAPTSDVSREFDKYLTASTIYNTKRAALVEQTHTLLGDTVAAAFEDTLNTDITPSLARSGHCVSTAYVTYMKGKNEEARTQLDKCETRPHRVAFSYGTEIGKLQTCLGTFDKLLAEAVAVEDGFADMPANKRQNFNENADLSGLQCAKADFVCRKEFVAQNLANKLRDGCGPLATEKYHKAN